MSESFFIHEGRVSIGYKNLRDSNSEMCQKGRELIERLWAKYQVAADSHFRSDARLHITQRFWEMFLYCALTEQGLRLGRFGNAGPEFYFFHEGRKIWCEAIAPEAGDGPDALIDHAREESVSFVDSEKIILRLTHAAFEKAKKLKLDRAKGIVGNGDQVLLCINTSSIPNAPFGAELPFFIKAFLPFGSPRVSIDKETLEYRPAIHEYRDTVVKGSGAEVSTSAFATESGSPFVGIIHSVVDPVNCHPEVWRSLEVLHNPFFTPNLQGPLFSWMKQFVVSGNELLILNPVAASSSDVLTK